MVCNAIIKDSLVDTDILGFKLFVAYAILPVHLRRFLALRRDSADVNGSSVVRWPISWFAAVRNHPF